MPRGRLKPEDEKCIQHNYVYLKKNIEALNIVDYLYQHEVITLEDKEHIYKPGLTRIDRNEILLSTLKSAGPDEAFNYFLKSLELDYNYVLKHIKQTANDLQTFETMQNEIKHLKIELAKDKVSLQSQHLEINLLKDNIAKDKSSLQYQLQENSLLNDIIAKHQEKITFLQDKYNNNKGENEKAMGNLNEKKLLLERKNLIETLEHHKRQNKILSEQIAERISEIEILKMKFDIDKNNLQKEIETLMEERAQCRCSTESDKNESCSTVKQQGTTDNVHVSSDSTRSLKKLNNKYIETFGIHETDLFLNDEDDASKHLASCKKNPGHTNFIPFEMFKVNDLPEGYREQHLYMLIKALAELTVRVDVTTTSISRPEFYPGTQAPYPFSNIRERAALRTGTGFVENVKKIENEFDYFVKKPRTCACMSCKASGKPNEVFWEITVVTAEQVIFDESEAEHSSVRLFYDRKDSPLVIIDRCTSYLTKCKQVNRNCYLIYETCDPDICDKLEDSLARFVRMCNIIISGGRYKDDKFICIVSHPHGSIKTISFGKLQESVLVEKKLVRLIYTTSTCAGSSGAFVYRLGCTSHTIKNVALHSGSTKTGSNYSDRVVSAISGSSNRACSLM